MTTSPLKLLFKRLRDVNLPMPYVRQIALPSWWDDKIAENPVGYSQLLMFLSRYLGLNLKSLHDSSAALQFNELGECKYKKRSGTTENELRLSSVIATHVAKLAAAAVTTTYSGVPAATEIRQYLLESAMWVSFERLLDYCWSVGIPVVHINAFPKGAKRPEGFTLRAKGRPAIVLCRNEKQPAWQLFILAHELGHIALGHVPENGALFDEKVNDNEQDDEETAADKFAIELLTGDRNTALGTSNQWPNAKNLAQLAIQFGTRNQVDPGHVILNYAHTMGNSFFAVARSALNLITPDANAVEMIRVRLASQLDWSQLPEDSSEFLMRITGQENDECSS